MTDTDTKRVVGDGSELGIVFWDRRNWTRYVNVNAVAIPFHNPPPTALSTPSFLLSTIYFCGGTMTEQRRNNNSHHAASKRYT